MEMCGMLTDEQKWKGINSPAASTVTFPVRWDIISSEAAVSPVLPRVRSRFVVRLSIA
jgi:hypothetical protein